jgi:hypothetical protein
MPAVGDPTQLVATLRARARVRRARPLGRLALVLLGAALAACASSGGKWRQGRFVDPELGAEISDLAALEAGWREEGTERATLAYRHVDGTLASWLRECRRIEANPRALARAVWIALPKAEIAEEHALDVGGAPGWRIRGRAPGPVLVESVSRITKQCEDTWLLVSPHSELHHAEAFERWWRGLRDTAEAP